MKKENKKIKVDFGTILLITGALANVPLWIGAFTSTSARDGGTVSTWIRVTALPVISAFAALAMGVTVAFGLVYVVVQLGKMKPVIETKVRGKDEYKTSINYRFYGALLSTVLLLAISAALLSPFELMMVSGSESLYTVLGARYAGLWSFGRVLAADVALGAIALVHGVQLGAFADAKPASESKSQSNGSGVAGGRSAKGSGGKAKGAKPLVLVACRYQGAGCAQTGSQNAMNAHAPHCKFKPTIDDSLMLKNQSNKRAEK